MSEWTVHAEFTVADDASDDQIDTLMEVLRDYHGIVAGGRGSQVGLTFTMEAGDARQAAAGGYEVAVGALMKAGIEHRNAFRLEVADADVVAAELAVSNFPDVVGSSEVAKILDVSRQRLHQLREREDFPLPMLELAATPIWLRSAIDGFNERWLRLQGSLGHRAEVEPGQRRVWTIAGVEHAPEHGRSSDRRCLCGEEYEDFGTHLAEAKTAADGVHIRIPPPAPLGGAKLTIPSPGEVGRRSEEKTRPSAG